MDKRKRRKSKQEIELEREMDRRELARNEATYRRVCNSLALLIREKSLDG